MSAINPDPRAITDGIRAASETAASGRRAVISASPSAGMPRGVWSTLSVQGLTEILVERSLQLRDVWGREITNSSATGVKGLCPHRNICVGFNYQFNALEAQGKPSELNQAFSDLFHSPNFRIQSAFRVAQAMIPKRLIFKQTADAIFLMPLPGQKAIEMRSIGDQLLPEGKAAVKAGGDKEFSELFTLSTDKPTMEVLNALPYLENVVREALPAHPLLPAAMEHPFDRTRHLNAYQSMK
ncbi:hypothetical protein C8J57DRAFT_1226320 [Mycena rebaudengoi]|nr:hypothetical protein C8J57DRAFT_1226320 [Mycena rebaudengoi]